MSIGFNRRSMLTTLRSIDSQRKHTLTTAALQRHGDAAVTIYTTATSISLIVQVSILSLASSGDAVLSMRYIPSKLQIRKRRNDPIERYTHSTQLSATLLELASCRS
jgi:hypothetical protein